VTTTDRNRLLDLLPAIYRLRDAEDGGGGAGRGTGSGPLEALLAVLAEQVAVVEDSVDALYADQFIETCADWVVPYLGDLVGVRALHEVAPSVSGARAEVAHTIGYRRRKGTAAMLAQLARDVTGWPAHVVEYFELLGATQYLRHLRPGRGGTARIGPGPGPRPRSADAAAFDPSAHTVDTRTTIDGGRYNIPTVGIFLWRLAAYPLEQVTAREVAPGCYTVHPFGIDTPLFNQPRPEAPDGPLRVPAPLARRALHEEVEGLRQAAVDRVAPAPAAYFADPPVLTVYLDGAAEPVPADEIVICDLSGPMPWRRPASRRRTVAKVDAGAGTYSPIRVAADPVLGRLTFPTDAVPTRVEVSAAYGFGADIGGGPYDRTASVPPEFTGAIDWQRGVGPGAPLAEAVDAWNAWAAAHPGATGVVAVLDNGSYPVGDRPITVPPGSRLLLIAAGQPELGGQLVPVGRRPHLRGDLRVVGGGALALNGLLIEGTVAVLDGTLQRLELAHCTVSPDTGGVSVREPNPGLAVDLRACLTGPIHLDASVSALTIQDSVIASGPARTAVAAPGAALDLLCSTVFGTTQVRTIEAGNAIFTGTVTARLRQIGCVRFSYLPGTSRVPRRYRCVTDDPATTVVFTSTRYGDPGYAQLASRCPAAIGTGADDGAEMGAFHDLFQPQRLANLQLRLEEYLRFGLTAGVHLAS
jgi:hypothetical protein